MKRLLKGISAVMVIMLMLSLAACGVKDDSTKNNDSTNKNGAYPLTITDSLGVETTFEQEPERVVSMTPNVTEMIYALGLGDKLVGRTTYCDYPAEASSVQDIGDIMNPNIEKIVELNPDVVIASTFFSEEVAEKFKELNIKVVAFYTDDKYEGVYEMLESIGKIFNVEDKAQQVVSGIKEKLAEVEKKVAGQEPPTAYYVVSFGSDGDFTSTGDTYVHQLITMAGGDNIAKDATGWSYSKEKLIEQNPDIILVPDYFYDSFITTEGYKDLDAVKNNKVYIIDVNLIDRQGPRLGEGVEALAKLFHPESFK